MNINPQAKRILCFWDSNTYGTIPYQTWSTEKKRYSITERWTWILQKELWNSYEIIEEWRWWRTIHVSLADWTDIMKIGSLFLEWSFYSHYPLDLFVVMLGTNDIKPIYSLDPQDICNDMEKYIITLVQHFWSQLLIISPPSITDGLHNNFPWWSHKKIKKLNSLYKKLCLKHWIYYIDIQKDLICWSDGIHLTKTSHKFLWTALSKKIKEII